MTLNQLRYLLAIVDANFNISLAAARTNATQPGISRQLKLIEEELGFRVFARKGKNLQRLTRAGEELIARARAIVGEIRNIETLAANHREETRGLLRLAATQTLGRYVLPSALLRLRARFGGVQVRLRPGGQDECLDLLDRDEIDLALVSTEGSRPPGDVAIPLFHWNRAVIAPRTSALAARAGKLTLAELAALPLVAADAATHSQYKVGRVFHDAGLVPNIACTARDADTIKAFVRLDLGTGIVAEMALLPADDDLVDLGGSALFPLCTTWAILRSDRIQRDYLFELLRELAPMLPREDILALIEGAEPDDLTAKVLHWRMMAARAPIAAPGPVTA